MSKISLWGILRGYLNTLHSGSNKQILRGDVAAQIFLPLGCSCFVFFNVFGSKDAVSNMLQGILTWVSIASALLCGVAIMIFQLRLQLASQKDPEPTKNETRLIDEDSCRARYTENDMIKMLETREGILTLEDELNNRRFACTYVTELRTTKKSDAALTFRMAEEGETPATVLKTLVKPFDKYPYRPNKAVEAINLKLEKEKTVILYGGVDTRTMGKSSKPFNMYHFGLFTSYYSMKNDDRYSTNNALPNEPPAYIYSQQAIDLIISRLIENPTGILDKLKAETKKVV